MGSLAHAAGGIVLAVVIVALVLWALHFLFGSQVFGVPALIAVAVLFALRGTIASLGPLAIAGMLVALLLVFAIIGMAMTLGAGKPPHAHDERPKDG